MSRPSQVLLVMVVAGVGALCGSARGGDAALGALAIGGVLLLAATLSIHTINEYADVDTDAITRRTAFSGGSGALHDLDLPAAFAGRFALGAGAVTVAAGLAAWASGTLTAASSALLIAGLVGGWLYSVGLRLSRHGFGEVLNAVLGGLVLPLYGASLVGAAVSAQLAALFVPFTMLVMVNLLATHWADRTADAVVGKRTLAVRWSARTLRGAACVLTTAAYGGIAVLASTGTMPAAVAVASLTALPLSLVALVTLTRTRSPALAVAAMVTMLLSQGVGWWWVLVSP